MLVWSLSKFPVSSPQVLFQATVDNIIEYKAPGTGSSPCQDQFQVRGCEKVVENSLKGNFEISPGPENIYK